MKVVSVAMRRPMVCRWWRSSGALMAPMRRRSAGTSSTGECCEGAGRGEPARQGTRTVLRQGGGDHVLACHVDAQAELQT